MILECRFDHAQMERWISALRSTFERAPVFIWLQLFMFARVSSLVTAKVEVL